MSVPERLATALQAVIGPENLLSDAAAAEYAVDGVSPGLVVFPADDTQVAAVLRLADEHRATVCPRGGGTNMALGHIPERVDVVLSLSRLHQQLAYEPADMTTTVQAGLRLQDLQQTLGQHGQRLALDPPGLATTTVGGVVAANGSGPRRLLYGTARDLLLGLAVVSLDGKRTKAGGRVVKNVTGYDLNKLYIGSLGTLAVIVELTFKLHPLPPGESTLSLGLTQPGDILPVMHTLRQLPLRLNSLEVLNAAAATALQPHADLTIPDTAYVLFVRLEGSPEVTARQEQRLVAALRALSLAGRLDIQPGQDAGQAHLWQAIEAFPHDLPARAPQGAMSKVSVRVSDLSALFQEMTDAAQRAGRAWPVLAHAGNGTAYVFLPPDAPGETADPARLLTHLQMLDACVARLHGHRVLERAPAAVKRQCDVWGTPGNDFPLMRAIKATFDPHRLLNPGRFLGGL